MVLHVLASSPSPSRELARPLPLLALAVLVLNDHWLKSAGVLPGWLTGKLSDAAGMFLFPVLLFALVQRVNAAAHRGRRALLLAGLTAAAFAAIKIWPPANGLANQLLGRVLLDPTDAYAVLFAAGSALYLQRPPRAGHLGAERCALVLAAAASLASSSSHRGFPFWRISEPGAQDPNKLSTETPTFAKSLGCASLQAEVVQSGKEGIGFLLIDRSPPECVVQLAAAEVRVGHVVTRATLAPWDRERSIYLAFAFDNERLWNDGVREGQLELVLTGAATGNLRFQLWHSFPGPHEYTPRGGVPVLSDAGAAQ